MTCHISFVDYSTCDRYRTALRYTYRTVVVQTYYTVILLFWLALARK
jgi:hypothetical protein